jgi:quinol-cytochrome oxidoreductase complex cytochrome b subunit/mono/diheme cytochrome c family protein
VLARLCDWFDHRTGYRKLVSALLLEHVPGGAKWRYVWGSVLAFVFAIQLITGLLLMTSYSPGNTTAWGSVYFIQYEMQFGWLIRGLHHFGSQTMVVLLAIHMLQVVIAGAHLAPREVNWWLGLALMGAILGLSLTGYLLPWDQKGYWATQVATSIAGSLPGPGSFIKRILVGGAEYGNHTLSRFYALHVGVLPALVIVLLVMHVAVFRRHGVTVPKDTKGEGEFWPDQAFKDMVACMVLFGLLLAVVIWGGQGNELMIAANDNEDWFDTCAYWGRHGGGANLDAPSDPSKPYPARPEWYFLFLFQLLKYFQGSQAIVGTVIIPNGVALLLFMLPLFGFGKMRPLGHIIGVLVVVGVLAGAGTLTCLALADDMPDPVRRHLLTQIGLVAVPAVAGVLLIQIALLGLLPRGGFRGFIYVTGVCVLAILVFATGSAVYGAMTDRLLPEVHDQMAKGAGLDCKEVTDKTADIQLFRHQIELADENAERAVQLAHKGIPAEGPVLLLQRDPMTAGKALFKQHCNTCHRYGDIFPAGGLKASDLGGFGSPDEEKRKKWIRGLLENPGHKDYFGLTNLKIMKKWRKDTVEPALKAMNPKEKEEYNAWLDQMAGWLASQPTKDPPEDNAKAKVAKGPFAAGFRAFMDVDRTKPGRCSACHSYKGFGSSSAPDFAGYGSAEWLRLMIMAPAHDLRHSGHNEMPAFRDTLAPGSEVHDLFFNKEAYKAVGIMPLSDIERELIIRFVLQDDRLVFFGRPITGPPLPKTKK